MAKSKDDSLYDERERYVKKGFAYNPRTGGIDVENYNLITTQPEKIKEALHLFNEYLNDFKTDNEKYPNDIIVGASFFHFTKIGREFECSWNDPENKYKPHFEPYQELVKEKAANGYRGTVYPANCFKDERFLNRKLAEYVSPTADEDWCHFFAMLGGIKQRMCSKPNLDSKDNNSNNKEALYKRHSRRFYSILATNLSRLLGII
jgi:hypothetical protein